MSRSSKNGRVDASARFASDRIRQLRGRTTSLSRAVADQASGLAASGAARAQDARVTLEGQARQHLPEMRERIAEGSESVTRAAYAIGDQVEDVAAAGAERAREAKERFFNEAAPALRELATQAATLAMQRWESARTRAADTQAHASQSSTTMAHQLAQYRPDPGEVLKRAQRTADALIDQAKRAGDEIVESARATLGLALSTASDRTADVSEPAIKRAKSVQAQAQRGLQDMTGAAKQTSNDAFGFVIWAAAAAGIVWYILIKPERRKRIENFARSTWDQGNDLYRDLKGYDEAF